MSSSIFRPPENKEEPGDDVSSKRKVGNQGFWVSDREDLGGGSIGYCKQGGS